MNAADSRGAGARQKISLALGALGAIALLAALVLSRFGISVATEWFEPFAQWAQMSGPGGWIMFVLVQTMIAMIGLVPASLLGIAAGGLFGVILGFALSALGTLLGGCIAFLLARSLLRPWVVRMLASRINSRLIKLDTAVTRDGWRIVCLLRISPVMPFAITSYALGITDISVRNYMLGTLASLPALGGYVGLGALAGYGVRSTSTGIQPGAFGWILLSVGVAATALLIFRSGMLLARCGLLPARPWTSP